MDRFKLIPQVFFDLFGRVVPGAVAVLAALLLSKETWNRGSTRPLARRLRSRHLSRVSSIWQESTSEGNCPHRWRSLCSV